MRSARFVSISMLTVSAVALLAVVVLNLEGRTFSVALCAFGTSAAVGAVLWCIPSAALIYRIGYRDGATRSCGGDGRRMRLVRK